MTDLAGIRWIGKTTASQKRFMRALLDTYEYWTKTCPVNTIGYRKGTLVDDVAGIILQALHEHHAWGSQTQIWMSSHDIHTASEQMKHKRIAQTFSARGIPAHLITTTLREIGEHIIELTQCEIQGGVGTPFYFRSLTEASLENTLKQ